MHLQVCMSVCVYVYVCTYVQKTVCKTKLSLWALSCLGTNPRSSGLETLS